MIDNSDICIFAFDETYAPLRKFGREALKKSCAPISRSGTALAYKYAKQKKKTILNVLDKKPTY